MLNLEVLTGGCKTDERSVTALAQSGRSDAGISYGPREETTGCQRSFPASTMNLICSFSNMQPRPGKWDEGDTACWSVRSVMT